MTTDFLAGYGGDGRPPLPRTTPPGWQPGSSRAQVQVLACPVCGSLEIAHRDNGRTVQAMRFECRACGNAWRESPGRLVRAIAISP